MNEYQKIGAKTLKPIFRNEKWFFQHKNRFFPLAPSGASKMMLSPAVYGVDQAVETIIHFKKIPVESAIVLLSNEYIPGTDIKLILESRQQDGQIYCVEPVNYQIAVQKIWVCSYIGFLFENLPENIYVKAEHDLS